MTVSSGSIIAFSGIDGSGKSTQIELLLDHYRQQGQWPRYVWSRGGYTPRFELLKALWRRLAGRSAPPPGHNPQRTQVFKRRRVRVVWLTLALIELLFLYAVQVRWWRWRRRVVVCDRYLWDTLIDFRLNFPDVPVEQWLLWRWLVRLAPEPDCAFLLLVPVEESVRRSNVKGEPFRDTPDVLAERLAQYQSLTAVAGWHSLDGRLPVAELAAEILARVVRSGEAFGAGKPAALSQAPR